MDTISQSPRKPRSRVARGQARPQYLEPQDVDRLGIMFVALMSEVSALRDRLDTHEQLARLGQPATMAAVEALAPEPEDLTRREAVRQAMLKRVLRVITQERAPDGPIV